MQIFPPGRPTVLGSGKEGRGIALNFWPAVFNLTEKPIAFATPRSAKILLP